MEKVVIIDGKEVSLKVNASCLRRYKMQFRRDFIADIFRLKKLDQYIVNGELKADDETIAQIDFELFSDLLWLFAKTADKTIPSPLEWEEQFVSIPLSDTLPVVLELLTVMLDSSQKK
ncbi:hypothetical protein SAMN05880501_10754 [Ureibacillus xyleni]|uniref:Prophage pi2 protein 40 n=1 Tax=Ureibacillus xyleni TaxID=614648 RepID=A0A285SXM2_9BACL|nr:hypothetical protein [Ureibacillus xyleni]SOC12803.1 hypothetical protein SAMN05880501_10754 [Ureibacillus xyleni]